MCVWAYLSWLVRPTKDKSKFSSGQACCVRTHKIFGHLGCFCYCWIQIWFTSGVRSSNAKSISQYFCCLTQTYNYYYKHIQQFRWFKQCKSSLFTQFLFSLKLFYGRVSQCRERFLRGSWAFCHLRRCWFAWHWNVFFVVWFLSNYVKPLPVELTTRMADVLQMKSKSGTSASGGIANTELLSCVSFGVNVTVQLSTAKSAMSEAAITRLYETLVDEVPLAKLLPGKPGAQTKTGIQLPMWLTLHVISRKSDTSIALFGRLTLVRHWGGSEVTKTIRLLQLLLDSIKINRLLGLNISLTDVVIFLWILVVTTLFDFVVMRFLMKLFRTANKDIIDECRSSVTFPCQPKF